MAVGDADNGLVPRPVVVTCATILEPRAAPGRTIRSTGPGGQTGKVSGLKSRAPARALRVRLPPRVLGGAPSGRRNATTGAWSSLRLGCGSQLSGGPPR